MPTSLSTPLPSIHPVYDPLIASLQDGADLASAREGQSQVEVQLEVEDILGSDEWRLIGEYLNPYDYTTDLAKVSLHKALQGSLAPGIPDLEAVAIQSIPGLVKNYRLKARDVVDGEAVGEFTTTAASKAWLAGNSYPYIGQDLLTGKAYLFLTTRPLIRRFHPLELIHLQVIPVASGSPSLRILAVFKDGTDQTDLIALDPVTALVPFSYNITLPAYAKPVAYLEIDLTELAGSAEKLTYRLTDNRSSYFRQLFFRNSLGGLDHIPLTGKSEEFQDTAGETLQAQEYPPTDAQVGNSRAFNQSAADSFILRTGWMSHDEIKSLKDMRLRNEVYLLEGTDLRRLILANGSKRIKKDGDHLYALELSAQYAWNENAYSRS